MVTLISMKETLAERLKKAIEEAETSQAKLANHLGIERASVSEWTRGLTKNLKMENLFASAAFLRVRPEWLALGTGAKKADALTADELELLDAYRMADDEEKAWLMKTVKKAYGAQPVGDPDRRTAFEESLVAKTAAQRAQDAKNKRHKP